METITVDGLEAGTWSCVLQAPEHVGSRIRADVVAGKTTDVTVVLRRFGRIRGTVTNMDGPVPKVVVATRIPAGVMLNLARDDWKRLGEMSVSVQTDAKGEFTLEGLPPSSEYSVVTAHFAYRPQSRHVEVAPGATATIDISVAAGAHLSGTLVDRHGGAVPGATVYLLREKVLGYTSGWVDDARCTTLADGSFRSPALEAGGTYQVKTWLLRDGVHEVAQIQTVAPDEGTRNVGVLAPRKTLVTFILPQAFVGTGMDVTVVGIATANSEGTVMSGVKFDSRGEIRLVGLAEGAVQYSVNDATGRSRGGGEAKLTGKTLTLHVRIKAKKTERPKKTVPLKIDCPREALLLVTWEGAIMKWDAARTGDGRREVAFKLARGRYRLYCVHGSRIGSKEIDLRTSASASIDASRPGRSVRVRVVREGKSVAGAQVFVRGFAAGARGTRVPWTKSDAQGNATLQGLPSGIDVLEMAVMHNNGGRFVTLQRADFEGGTLDLGPPPPAPGSK